jgi:hypothetical protein
MYSTATRGSELADLLGHLRAAHLGHDDVGDEQVDLAVVPGSASQRLVAVGGGEDVVSASGEYPLGDVAESFFVLHDQDGLAGGSAFVGNGFPDRRGLLLGDRDHDGERRDRHHGASTRLT